jgi:putative transposase
LAVQLTHHSDAGSQYVSWGYRQTLNDHQVLGSIGSVGDACDNAMAESFVDSFKTELIKDRVWQTRTQLELAILEYVAWFNNTRLHQSLGDRPPAEVEGEWLAQNGASEEPGAAKTAPSLVVDETVTAGLYSAKI